MKQPITPPAFADVPDRWHMSPGVDTGQFVFFSGVTGCRPDGTVSNEPEEQFREAFGYLVQTLAAGDLTLDDVVEMTSYHVDLRRHLEAFIRVKDTFVTAPYPAWSAVGVSELITEGALVEIRAIAQRSTSITQTKSDSTIPT